MARWDATIKYSGNLWSEPNVTPEVRDAMKEVREFAQSLIESRTPVDTGEMRSRWQVSTGDRLLSIINPTYYAGFVEFGTRRMAARNCLTGALPAIEKRFTELVLEKVTAKYGSGDSKRSSSKLASMMVGAKRGLIYQKNKMYSKV